MTPRNVMGQSQSLASGDLDGLAPAPTYFGSRRALTAAARFDDTGEAELQ